MPRASTLPAGFTKLPAAIPSPPRYSLRFLPSTPHNKSAKSNRFSGITGSNKFMAKRRKSWTARPAKLRSSLGK
jgi:hypothetical protein